MKKIPKTLDSVGGVIYYKPEILEKLNCYRITVKEDAMQAYCVKCRTKREMKDAKSITMKNGKPATQGVCPSCGTRMFRIGKV
jgi:RNase P subunit RPR2